jgi:hypothetical protein
MNPLQLSAQFAAYLWYINQPETAGRPRSEAHQFARLNWEQFLPNADEGFGRLLLAVADRRDEDPSVMRLRPRRPRFVEAAVAG